MTKQKLQADISKKLSSTYYLNSTGQDLIDGINSMNIGQQKALIKNIRIGNAKKLIPQLQDILKQSAVLKAESEAQLMLADDSLSLAELEKIL